MRDDYPIFSTQFSAGSLEIVRFPQAESRLLQKLEHQLNLKTNSIQIFMKNIYVILSILYCMLFLILVYFQTIIMFKSSATIRASLSKHKFALQNIFKVGRNVQTIFPKSISGGRWFCNIIERRLLFFVLLTCFFNSMGGPLFHTSLNPPPPSRLMCIYYISNLQKSVTPTCPMSPEASSKSERRCRMQFK